MSITSNLVAVMLAWACTVAALKVIVPLYVYPNPDRTSKDGRQWAAVKEAIDRYPTVQFQVIINPSNGERDITNPTDQHWIDAIDDMNRRPNVRTFGYVYTGFGTRHPLLVKANMATYANYSQFNNKNISVHGIFFDEVAATPEFAAYYQDLTNAARGIFHRVDVQRILNPGVIPRALELYRSCEYLIAFEGCFRNNTGNSSVCQQPTTISYRGQPTIDLIIGAVGSVNILKTVILVHDYTGHETSLSELNRLAANMKLKVGFVFLLRQTAAWDWLWRDANYHNLCEDIPDDELESAEGTAQSVADKAEDRVKDTTEAVKEWAQETAEMVTEAGEKLGEAIEHVKEMEGTATETAKEARRKIDDSDREAVKQASESAKVAIDTASDVIADTAQTVKEGLVDAADTTRKTTKSAKESVLDKVDSLKDAIPAVEEVEEKLHATVEAVGENLKNLKDAAEETSVEAANSDIVEKAKKLTEEGVDKLREMDEKLFRRDAEKESDEEAYKEIDNADVTVENLNAVTDTGTGRSTLSAGQDGLNRAVEKEGNESEDALKEEDVEGKIRNEL
ncbi:hypothetical protein BV898_00298 [Hypsibius exemplaris]|uniref:Spherulin-4 n=1 Tax=Hypsibius exemplaris TaxID=2072580 RepID=A0A1W0XFK0_HYPEX|nr:hypothetical protein BV898_00298 [Hypsibius exemplaris]